MTKEREFVDCAGGCFAIIAVIAIIAIRGYNYYSTMRIKTYVRAEGKND